MNKINFLFQKNTILYVPILILIISLTNCEVDSGLPIPVDIGQSDGACDTTQGDYIRIEEGRAFGTLHNAQELLPPSVNNRLNGKIDSLPAEEIDLHSSGTIESAKFNFTLGQAIFSFNNLDISRTISKCITPANTSDFNAILRTGGNLVELVPVGTLIANNIGNKSGCTIKITKAAESAEAAEVEIINCLLAQRSNPTSIQHLVSGKFKIISSLIQLGFIETDINVKEGLDSEISIPIGVIEGTLPEGTSYTLNINYDASSTAQEGEDYNNVVQTIIIRDDQPISMLTIPIIDDDIGEIDETIKINISFASTSDIPGNIGLSESTATVTIRSEDIATIGIASFDRDFDATEADTLNKTKNFTLTRDKPTGTNLNLIFIVTGGTAMEEEDFTLINNFTLPAGSGDFTTTMPLFEVLDDSNREDNEEVMILLRLDNNMGYALIDSMENTSTVTIYDDDASILLGFSATISTMEEGAAPFMELPVEVLMGTLPGGTSYDFMVSYRDINATMGTDYTPINMITISDTMSIPILMIPIIDDDIGEADEQFEVRLSSPLGIPSDTVVSQPIANVTITNDDMVTIGIAAADRIVTVTEASGAGQSKTFTITRDKETGTDLTLTFMAAPTSTATAADYIILNRVTLPAGSGDFTTPMPVFTVIDDNDDDDDEIVNVILGIEDGKGYANVNNSENTSQITITDDDDASVTIGFTAASRDVSVDEGDGMVNLTVEVLSGILPPGANYTLNVTYTDGSATAADADYDNTAVTMVTITSATPSTMISIPILDDSTEETNENFMVTITDGSSVLPGTTSISPDTATVTITDDDSSNQIGFDSASYTVAEDAVSIDVVIDLLGGILPADTSYTFDVSYTDATATAGSDYDQTSAPIIAVLDTDGSGVTTPAILSITIIDDDIGETDETFMINLSTSGSLPPGTAITQNITTVTITSDDMVIIGIATADRTVTATEASGAGQSKTFTITRDKETGTDLTLTFMAAPTSTATAADYIILNRVTLPAGSGDFTTPMPVFTVIDDNDDDDDEIVNVILGIEDGKGYANVNNSENTSQITITDDDDASVTIGFTAASRDVSVDEGDGMVNLTVEVLSGILPPGANYTLNVTYTDGSATAADADYDNTAVTMVTITSATPSTMISIPILDDSTEETNENFMVTITDGSSVLPGTTSISPDTATVTITNDDDPSSSIIGFDIGPYTVAEDAGAIDVVINLQSGTLPADTSYGFDVSYIDGTATAGSDYDQTSVPFIAVLDTDGSGVPTPATLSIPIANDDIGEIDETFEVAIASIGSLPAGIRIGTFAITVTITNDDMVSIGIAATDRTITAAEAWGPGQSKTFTITRDKETGTDLNFIFMVTGGTATVTNDFTLMSRFTLPAGSGDFIIPTPVLTVVDDSDDDNDETIQMMLGIPNTMGYAMVNASENTSMITITDNDGACTGGSPLAILGSGSGAEGNFHDATDLDMNLMLIDNQLSAAIDNPGMIGYYTPVSLTRVTGTADAISFTATLTTGGGPILDIIFDRLNVSSAGDICINSSEDDTFRVRIGGGIEDYLAGGTATAADTANDSGCTVNIKTAAASSGDVAEVNMDNCVLFRLSSIQHLLSTRFKVQVP